MRSSAQDDELARAVFDALFRLGPLQRLLDDPEVENINANGADEVWLRYSDGRRERAGPIAASDEELVALLRNAAARVGIGERRFDLGSPRLSLQLPDGSRLFAVMAVSARPCLSVRRHRYLKVTCDDLVAMGTMDPALRELSRSLMRAKKSVVICGGTGAGKTTFLRAMAADIPPWERLVTIEDSFELELGRYPELHPDVVALEAREPNLEGEGGVSLAELVRWALRLSPDRVIVGEVTRRGGAGAAERHVPGHRRLDDHPARLELQGGVLQDRHLRSPGPRTPVARGHQPAGGQRRALRGVPLRRPPGPAGRLLGPRGRRRRRRHGRLQRGLLPRPQPPGRAGVPLRSETLDELEEVGFDPGLLQRAEGWWER